MGELFQNNHHERAMSPHFAFRWFEIDPAYQAIRVFAWLGVIRLRGAVLTEGGPPRPDEESVNPT